MHLVLAEDDESRIVIGYCLSTAVSMPTGTEGYIIELSVDGKYRSHGIGSTLVKISTEWFGNKNVKKNKSHIAGGQRPRDQIL